MIKEKQEILRPLQRLSQQQKNHNNDYYTRMNIVEMYLNPYIKYFKGKVIYCPCDYYKISNFVKYFIENYHNFGLKGLYATNYAIGNMVANEYYYDGEKEYIKKLADDGSCISELRNELYEKCDVIITNPPFTLDVFNPFFKKLIEMHKKGKDFLVFGGITSAYKMPFKYLQNEDVYLSVMPTTKYPFDLQDGSVIDVGFLCYQTFEKPKPRLIPKGKFDNLKHLTYDNYDAINVDKFEDIPVGYEGNIGMPPTCIGHAVANGYKIIDDLKKPIINGVNKFERIIIRKKTEEELNNEKMREI